MTKKIKLKILFINSLNDRVIDPKKVIEMSRRLKNSKIINFKDCEHEIFMEKDCHRIKLWESNLMSS